MRKNKILFLTQGAVVAALYVSLSFISLKIYPFDFRLSEALCVLPWCMPASIPGLFIGCIISNLISACNVIDVVFGSLTTLIAACLTFFLRRFKWIAPVPPILLNTIVLPFIFVYVYNAEEGLPFFFMTVGVGEIVSVGVLGSIITFIFSRYRKYIIKK